MTYAPQTLVNLGHYWTDQGGVNLGIVGDPSHVAKGTSYHLGKDQLEPGAYSTKTPRDQAGLTDAASAIDLGKLDGTYAALRSFSTWLVNEAQHNAAGTSDMREIIYSPDGKVVLRWDRERGYASDPRPGEADDSHLTHTHVSWYRDAEARDHTTAFRPYFSEATMPDIYVTDDQPMELDLLAGAEVLNPADGSLRTKITATTAGAYTSPFGGVTPGGTATRTIVWTHTQGKPFLLACYKNDAKNLRPLDGSAGDADAIRAARDEEWRTWLLEGSPGGA